MKDFLKYMISAILIAIVSVYIINVAALNKEDSVRGTITIWAKNETYEYLSSEAANFMQENERVNIDVVNTDSATYENQVRSAIENGNGPDVIQGNSSFINDLEMNYGDLLDLDENNKILNDYSNNFLGKRKVIKNSNYLGIPFTSRPLVLYLRQDILEKYNYLNSDIQTWQDLINVGKNIFEKSEGKIRLLNAVEQDYDDLVSLIIMQAMEESKDKEKIKETVDGKIHELEINNILNKDINGQFLGRISSVNGMNELKAINEECKWTANDVPAVYPGSNRFYVSDDEALSIIIKNDRNKNLYDTFIRYISLDSKNNIDYVTSGKCFFDFSLVSNNREIEKEVNNFEGKSPLVVMSNVANKANAIKDYDLYCEIYNEYK